jgi:hypothetical protein
MEDIKIIDDFLPTYIQDFLEGGFYGNMNLSLIKKTLPNINNNDYFDDEQLECWVKHPNSENSLALGNSHFYLLPLQIGCLRLGINFNFENLFRAKLNIKFNTITTPSLKINPPHLDTTYEHPFFIGIYYINDSDGNTIIYDGKNKENLKLFKEIEPKKGRLILFDGQRYHSASHPNNSKKRIVMNYNVFY